VTPINRQTCTVVVFQVENFPTQSRPKNKTGALKV